METPITELIKSLDNLENTIVSKESLRETLIKYLEKEKKTIKFAFVAGFASPQTRLTGTCAERYYNETFKKLKP